MKNQRVKKHREKDLIEVELEMELFWKDGLLKFRWKCQCSCRRRIGTVVHCPDLVLFSQVKSCYRWRQFWNWSSNWLSYEHVCVWIYQLWPSVKDRVHQLENDGLNQCSAMVWSSCRHYLIVQIMNIKLSSVVSLFNRSLPNYDW